MRPALRALLQQIADVQRQFAHPSDELVRNLYELESLGYVRNVKTVKDHQSRDENWYSALAYITEEGLEALKDEK